MNVFALGKDPLTGPSVPKFPNDRAAGLIGVIDPIRPVHARIRPALAALTLALGGCTVVSNGSQQPTVMLSTPMGAQVINPAAAAPPGGALAGPPPGMSNSLPVPAQAANRSGSYAGTAEPFNTGGGDCLGSHHVSGWHVNGRAVRWGGFRGKINADDGLQMAYGENWIVGQFDGGSFHGQFDLNGRFGGLSCSYILSLTRVGP